MFDTKLTLEDIVKENHFHTNVSRSIYLIGRIVDLESYSNLLAGVTKNNKDYLSMYALADLMEENGFSEVADEWRKSAKDAMVFMKGEK